MIVGLRCIVTNYSDNFLKRIEHLIQEVISKKYSDVTIELFNVQPYWKFPDETEIVFKILSKNKLSVEKIAELFSVEWTFTGRNSSAIWSQHMNQDLLLDKNVTWVHLYEWNED
jgi:hypothetical protein